MAIKDKTQSTSATGRRWFFGTNVMVVIGLVVFVLIAVNWFGHRYNYRRDFTGGFASYRLSDRTKQIISQAEGPLRITTVYTSDDPEMDRKKYFPKLRDYCEEIKQFKRSVKIAHLHSGNERAELRDRIQEKFATAATEYRDVVDLATALWDDLANILGPQQQAVAKLLQGDSWLGGFSTLANIATVLRKDLEKIDQTRKEVNELVHSQGIPRFQEANTKIKAANDDLKKHLEETEEWMKEMDKLAKVLADPDSEFADETRKKAQGIITLVARLKQIIGDPTDQNVPEDVTPVLQEYAKAANKTAGMLVAEIGRVNAFVKQNPAIKRHPKWTVRIQQAIFVSEAPLVFLLENVAENISGSAQQVRTILARKVPKDQMQSAIRQLRKITYGYDEKIKIWTRNVMELLTDGSRIDEQSKSFLVAGSTGQLFGDVLDRLNEVGTKISELPELELDEIAKRLQEDNIVIVENDKDVWVLKFDEVWAIADPMGRRFSSPGESQRRVFDGDSGISGAILSMEMENPFATVILVAYEVASPSPMPQMQRAPRKRTGPIPLTQLTTLKEKLEKMNFAVKEWNLGAEGEDAKQPEVEEGTKPIYVFLPPAPSMQPNFMMMRQPPQKRFGEAELTKVREALAQEGRAIFLNIFEPQMPMRLPPEKGYGQLLKDDWGIDPEIERRVIRGVVDTAETGERRYAIGLSQWAHMQLSSFTDHAIGAPLRSRRMLMTEVCPVVKAEKVPEGVTVSSVLEVPASAHDFWAENDITGIIRALRTGERRGTFTKSPQSWDPPFSVILAAENEKTSGKVVAMGTGFTFMNYYLDQRVMRVEGKQGRLVTDPPPKENLDLFINALYWLSGREDLIASGPADVPVVPAIEASSKRTLWLIAVGWSFAVLVVGGMVMMVRRK